VQANENSAEFYSLYYKKQNKKVILKQTRQN